MILSNDMIRHILEDHLLVEDIYQKDTLQCGFNDLVDGITVELNATIDTERRLRDIAAEERMLTEEHEKAYDELQVAKREVISQCRHHSITYHPDASGGSDSSTTCDTCGKELRRGG